MTKKEFDVQYAVRYCHEFERKKITLGTFDTEEEAIAFWHKTVEEYSGLKYFLYVQVQIEVKKDVWACNSIFDYTFL